MRGPSSSHTAASWRIARICHDILNKPLNSAVIEFDKDGAWASNYMEQGTVMGINAGLLGLDIIDDKMKHTEIVAKEMGIKISYAISSFPTNHANTVRLTLVGSSGRTVRFIGVSIGGGAFEIQQIDNFPVCIKGDYFELLGWTKKNESIPGNFDSIVPANSMLFQASDNNSKLVNIKSSKEFSADFIKLIKKNTEFEDFVLINPILPIVSGNESEMPFNSIESVLEYAKKNKLDMGDVGLIYEQGRSGLSEKELASKMENIIENIEDSIKIGLAGTDYNDRILHQQSHLIGSAEKEGKILKNAVTNNIIRYVTAIMEAKSAMEVVVANPTAGSCGTIGGALKGVTEELDSTPNELVKAYFACGIIGAFFAQGVGFSAEEYGCQVECGAASGMAAAGIVQLMGGTATQAINASSMAIQNMIGLVCDPVADRVEVPCLGKNISAAMNALSSATMASSGFDAVIPLDEVIQTVVRVGKKMPASAKCTGKGGLSITDTSIKIKEQIKNLKIC